MSSDLSSDDVRQLRSLFLRELLEGLRRARAAHAQLTHAGGDDKALQELRGFFHRVAGTAASVQLTMLGRLCAACEGAADLVVESAVPVSRTALNVFNDGLKGVEAVLESEGAVESEPGLPPMPQHPEPSPVLTLDGRAWRVLVIDDDPFSARLLDNVLRSAGLASTTCSDPSRAFDVVQEEMPDLILLDVVMPEQDGFELCRRIRTHPALQLTPIIFVTRKGDVEQRVRGLQMGGNDYVAKPFEPQELVARVRSHLQRLAELREMAIRDGLTRCFNSKYFKSRLETEIIRARRYGSELTLGILDVDHFKRINDTFGHPAGDAVLAHLASLLTASVRSTDVVARYGGEEFGIMLIEAAVPEAAIIINRLRERIARHQFVVPALAGGDLNVSCTVSIGLASLRPGEEMGPILARSDAALLEAKHNGRNQVRVAP
ncbi:MAG: diguanylate cyclase [Deltaproteobacteria bacterium]|nr:diguanylate cyclase [Deltaproteobacteria bacterium]